MTRPSQRPGDRFSVLSLLFLGSFAATATQLLFVKLLESFTRHEVFSYTVIVSTAFFALASGAKKTLVSSSTKSILPYQILLLIGTPLFFLSLYYFPALLVLNQLLRSGGTAYLQTEQFELVIPIALLFVFFLSRWHGAEIPLLSNTGAIQFGTALGISYLGALAGYLLIPFVFLPKLGLLATLFSIGFVYAFNCFIAGFYVLKTSLLRVSVSVLVLGFSFLFALGFGRAHELQKWQKIFFYANGLDAWPEQTFNTFQSVLKHLNSKMQVETIESPYQTIDLVSYQNVQSKDLRLYLNSDFQFDSSTEKQYHENFLKPLSLLKKEPARKILVLGAGDGLLIRDLLEKNQFLEEIVLVELDPEVTQIAKHNPALRQLNQNSLASSKVRIEVDDAFEFLRREGEQFDLILIDLPHPVSFALSKVFSLEFYENVRTHLKEDGALILDAPTLGSENIIQNTLRAAGFRSLISFGDGNTFIFAELSKIDYLPAQLQILNVQSEENLNSQINSIWTPKLPLLF